MSVTEQPKCNHTLCIHYWYGILRGCCLVRHVGTFRWYFKALKHELLYLHHIECLCQFTIIRAFLIYVDKSCFICTGKSIRSPLPWAGVHWLVQCTLECHWLTQCTLGYHLLTQKILVWYTRRQLEKLDWYCLTLGRHWIKSNYCNLHKNTTCGTVTALTHPGTELSR